MSWFLLLSSVFLMAHTELESMSCGTKDSSIELVRKASGDYSIQFFEDQKSYPYSKPTVEDHWDNDKKQMFDVYTFSGHGRQIVVRKPETQGPVTSTQLEYSGQTYKCQ